MSEPAGVRNRADLEPVEEAPAPDRLPGTWQLAGIGGREWLLAVALALGTVLLLLLPYWLAYEATGPQTAFTGIVMNPEDSQTYFAKMRTGYEGRWLYRVPFTAEAHEPFFVGAFYIALGHGARLLGLGLAEVWHGARLISGLVLFLATFAFTGIFFQGRARRWVAYLLAVFGSGLGWLLFLLNEPYWLGHFPVDFKMPEAHLFFSALTFPHVALTTALLLLTFWLTLKALHDDGRARWGYALAAGAVNVLIAVLHPLLVYVIALAGSLYWLTLALQARRILWRRGFAFAISLLMVSPLVLYYAYTLMNNEVFRGWNAQREITQSPPWPHFLLAFGPMLAAALLVWTKRRRTSRPPWAFLWSWVLAVALLVYAPLSSQRRFVQGVQVPLAILAVAGLSQTAWPWLRQRSLFRRLVRHPRYSEQGMAVFLSALFLLFMSLSNAYLLASVSVTAAVQQPYPLFRPQDEVQATRWLRQNTERSDVVLGAYQTGNYVAAHAGNPVIVGHWAETINFARKEEQVQRFFMASTSHDWRRRFLQRHDVQVVWVGPQEQQLGSFAPRDAGYLQPVHRRGSIAIFRVSLP